MASKQKLEKALQAAKSKASNMRKTAEEQIGAVVTTLEVGGTSLGLSYGRGRYGEAGNWEVVGVPVDLGVAALSHGFALLGGFGSGSDHMRAVGDGALACYLAHKGMDWGYKAANKAGTSGPRALHGQSPAAFRRPAAAGRAPAADTAFNRSIRL